MIVFIDYILKYFKNKDEHESHLRMALQDLEEQYIYAKFSKCEFWLRSVAFHGHIFSGNGVEVIQKKTDVVRNWTTPLTPTDIWSFLCLSGYYRRFVDGF